jgi:hypothetical protein
VRASSPERSGCSAVDPLSDILAACAESDPEGTWAVVRRWTEHGDPRFRVLAASFLGSAWPIYGESIASLLQELVNDEERRVQSAVKRAQAEMARLHMPVLRSRLSEAAGRRSQIVGRLQRLEGDLKEGVYFREIVLSIIIVTLAVMPSGFVLSAFLGLLIGLRGGSSELLWMVVLVTGGIGILAFFTVLDRLKRSRRRGVAGRREQYELEMASLREQIAELDTEIATKKAQIAALEKCSR